MTPAEASAIRERHMRGGDVDRLLAENERLATAYLASVAVVGKVAAFAETEGEWLDHFAPDVHPIIHGFFQRVRAALTDVAGEVDHD